MRRNKVSLPLEKNTMARMLHLPMSEPTSTDIVKSIRQGFSFKSVEDVSKELEISQKELSQFIGINVRTLSRRKVENKLHAEESDRLYRIVSIYDLALKVLKDKKIVLRWLSTSKVVLNGEVPLSLLDTEAGAKEVESL